MRKHLADFQGSEFKGWIHAESLVWRLVFSNGAVAYLKVHKRLRKFEQERLAYNNWVPHVSGTTPSLIAVKTEPPRALLLTSVSGQSVEKIKFSREKEQCIYWQAGDFLKSYHSIKYNDDDIPLNQAIEKRLNAWTARATRLIPGADIVWIKHRVLETLPWLRGINRVPCHRDFTPRNWLVDEYSKLSVIDFEHSRPDLFLLDVERLWSSVWQERPDLEEAFWDGYRTAPCKDEHELLERLAALGALCTIVWAKEHEDEAFELHGWRTLERLKKSA